MAGFWCVPGMQWLVVTKTSPRKDKELVTRLVNLHGKQVDYCHALYGAVKPQTGQSAHADP